MKDASPLRYPGGKWRITPFFNRLIELNKLGRPAYVEPYAGGASLALSLLLEDRVSEIHLNDLDPAIFAFWASVVTQNEDFLRMLAKTPVTPDEWHRQRHIFKSRQTQTTLDLGFATFFLNRTNHSGVLNGGMIGGKNQGGQWKLDARFNRDDLARRVARIGSLHNRIHVSNQDATEFVRNRPFPPEALVYFDPPYYRSGQHLYLNAYTPACHKAVSEAILALRPPWIVSYDDTRETRTLYSSVRSRRLQLIYSARSPRKGDEVLFFSPKIRIPSVI